jgi:hypothetical protein
MNCFVVSLCIYTFYTLFHLNDDGNDGTKQTNIGGEEEQNRKNKNIILSKGVNTRFQYEETITNGWSSWCYIVY